MQRAQIKFLHTPNFPAGDCQSRKMQQSMVIKMIKRFTSWLGIIAVFSATTIQAEESPVEQLRKTLQETMPKLEISDIRETPVAGVLELQSGGDIVYMTPDAKFMFQGAFIDLEQRVNLTDQRKGQVHMALINALPDEKTVLFKSDGSPTREITVFTDTSCPYCSKLHEEVGKLTDAGISVRYLLYPRAGMGSPAFRELQSVWCADDQQQAMTDAKQGKTIEEKTCDNPIEEHVVLAQQVGLRGTPLIYLDSGEIVNGYRPASEIIEMVKQSEPYRPM